ncbi:hypothetical protein [Nonomuraea wenchangensis]|uniref:hypothetical protein n=1 Tax=Nonomuraea wenchangensis TaxID=568860 RepID=UPI00332E509E
MRADPPRPDVAVAALRSQRNPLTRRELDRLRIVCKAGARTRVGAVTQRIAAGPRRMPVTLLTTWPVSDVTVTAAR